MVLVLKCVMFLFILVFMFLIFSKIFEKKTQSSFNTVYYLKRFNGYFSYENIEIYLKRRGFEYISPTKYIGIKLIVSVVFLLICELFGLYIIGIGAAIIGFFLIDIIILIKNRGDIQEIDDQLVNVYSLMEIQLAAGVFIGDVLSDAYLVVTNKRLKEGLAIMSATISITKNISAALENFKSRFDSESIDNFVMSIEQSLKTGQIEEEFEDLSREMADIREIAQEEQIKKIEDKAELIGIAIFVGITLIAVYMFGSMLLGNWSNTNL